MQAGGSFDVDYEVTGPGGKIMLEGEKERQGDFVFTAQDLGEYKFCFNNEMSTFADKTVDFEIAVENEARVDLPAKQGSDPLLTSALEESLFKLSGQLSTITRNQKYFRTRENRNFSTVRSTESRIFNFSLIQCGLVVCMGALQVFIVRFFFQVSNPQVQSRWLMHCADMADRVLARVTSKLRVCSLSFGEALSVSWVKGRSILYTRDTVRTTRMEYGRPRFLD